MKSIPTLFLTLIFSIGIAAASTPVPMAIGSDLPNQSQVLKDVSGTDLVLGELAGENGLLVIFTCNSCPYVLAWQDRYPGIAEYCEANGIGLVMVNPNEARRTSSDSYEAMQAHAKEHNFDFYYALDANHELADAMGATKTPDVFLFDADLKLAYQGAIDDNHVSAEDVKETFLQDAMDNLLKGAEIDPDKTKAIGCSIKRVK